MDTGTQHSRVLFAFERNIERRGIQRQLHLPRFHTYPSQKSPLPIAVLIKFIKMLSGEIAEWINSGRWPRGQNVAA